MTRLVVIQHVEREEPGLFAEVALERGWDLRIHHPYLGEPLPSLPAADEVLLVLGGPMGLEDVGSLAYPWLEPELALIRDCLALRLPLLGVCLGAQLIAVAAGGRVSPLEVGDPPCRIREVGWAPVSWLATPLQEPVLAGLRPSEHVLHWHGDRMHLPPQATLLGSTLFCREQMARFHPRAYGLQFHVEVTEALLERWLAEDGAYVRAALGPQGVERIRGDYRLWGEDAARQGRRLIANLLDQVDPAPPGTPSPVGGL